MPALNALRAFEVAGHTGSFTRAAEMLHVTQSAVSRQVRQLETQLGEPLLCVGIIISNCRRRGGFCCRR